MSINAIKSQLLGIHQAKTNVKTDVKEEEKKSQTAQTNPTTNKQVSAEDIFKYLSATKTITTPVTTKKTVNVNAYVNEESKIRISASMKDFEALFSSKLSTVKSEFGNISDDLAEKITLFMF